MYPLNYKFSQKYFEENLILTRMTPNGATFWFQGAICLCGQKDKDWQYLIPEGKLGLSNAKLN